MSSQLQAACPILNRTFKTFLWLIMNEASFFFLRKIDSFLDKFHLRLYDKETWWKNWEGNFLHVNCNTLWIEITLTVPLQRILLSIYTFSLSGCLFVCLFNPINVKTAEPIGPKFCVGSCVTPRKVYEWSKFKKIVLKKTVKSSICRQDNKVKRPAIEYGL